MLECKICGCSANTFRRIRKTYFCLAVAFLLHPECFHEAGLPDVSAGFMEDADPLSHGFFVDILRQFVISVFEKRKSPVDSLLQ